ncbi:MAG: Ferredoxin [Methanomassiliicoccales archaeon PtaU1.Bin124]|nr:MAG: Ferredoxin [Methanomassiliicoccales archaeon PtaU1.Bin124]
MMSMIRSSLKNLFSKPYTVRYPYESTNIPENSRGHVEWDMEACIFCRLCEKNCPGKAITTDKEGKSQTIVIPRCIQCRVCVDVCPVHCIYMRSGYPTPGQQLEVHTYAVGMERFHHGTKVLERKRRTKT